jgi:hypothetical protein
MPVTETSNAATQVVLFIDEFLLVLKKLDGGGAAGPIAGAPFTLTRTRKNASSDGDRG